MNRKPETHISAILLELMPRFWKFMHLPETLAYLQYRDLQIFRDANCEGFRVVVKEGGAG